MKIYKSVKGKTLFFFLDLVGKWHLGQSKKEYHPLNRGFNEFYGLLGGGFNHYTKVDIKYKSVGKYVTPILPLAILP